MPEVEDNPTTATTRGAKWWECFFAVCKKNAIVYKRRPIATLLELLIPAVFMILLSLGFWLSSNTNVDANLYNGPVMNTTSVIFDYQYCRQANLSIPLLNRKLRKCGHEYYGICSWRYRWHKWKHFHDLENICSNHWNDLEIDSRFLPTIDTPLIPFDLDSYLVLSFSLTSWYEAGMFQRDLRGSFFHAGKLALVDSTGGPSFSNAKRFGAHCLRVSGMCHIVLMDRVFATMGEAETFASNNGNVVWAILDVSNLNLPPSTDKESQQMQRKEASLVDKESQYTIRMNYTATPWTFLTKLPFSQGLGHRDFMMYVASGFVSLQQFVNDYIIETYDAARGTTGNGQGANKQPKFTPMSNRIAAKPFPTRPYVSNEFLLRSGHFIPLIMTFSLLYMLARVLSGLVEEKASRIRESMLIMGLPLSCFYAGWLLSSVLMDVVSMLCSTLVLRLTLFQNTDYSLMFVLNLSFAMTVTSLAMLLSVFFSKPRVAGIAGPLIMFIFTVPYYAIPRGTDMKYIIAASLLPCTAYAQSVNLMVSTAADGDQLSWGDIFSGSYSIALSLTMMWATVALYLLLAWYLDKVLPTEYGYRQHPLFFLAPLVKWCKARRAAAEGDDDDDEHHLQRNESESKPLISSSSAARYDTGGTAHVNSKRSNNSEDYELLRENSSVAFNNPRALIDPQILAEEEEMNKDTSGEKAPVVVCSHIDKVYKVDGEKRHAVKDLSFSLPDKQLTVLLGENGSGKSTTMNMLVGMLPPTNGSFAVCGFDGASQMMHVRRHLGYCPQHNVIWPQLTVEEHLQFYACIKLGLDKGRIEATVVQTLELVKLTEKRSTRAGGLSGGQKRKLCVGIALIGDSRFIILDEPTAGMDVEARRAILEILLACRRDRCILLSTHFMDEADLLGDRVLIVHEGALQAAGTPLFLKNNLGAGYTVHCVTRTRELAEPFRARIQEFLEATQVAVRSENSPKKKEQKKRKNDRDEDEGVDDAIASMTTSGSLLLLETTSSGAEVRLRFDGRFTSLARQLFEFMETQHEALGLHHFGLSLTTLEEVFINVGTRFRDKKKKKDQGSQNTDDNGDAGSPSPTAVLARAERPTFALPTEEDAAAGGDPSASSSSSSCCCRCSCSAFFRHFRAMLVKRAHCARRDRRTLCFQVVLPIVFLVIALLVLLLHAPRQPPVILDARMYGQLPEEASYTYSADPNDVSKENLALQQCLASKIGAMNGYYAPKYIPCASAGNGSSGRAPQDCSEGLSRTLLDGYNTHAGTQRFVALSLNGTSEIAGNTGKGGAPLVTVLHNATAPHSLPEALNLYANLELRRVAEGCGAEQKKSTHRITVINHPLPMSEEEQRLISSIKRVVSAVFILIPFTFVPAAYVTFIVREKECMATHLQWIAGVDGLAYWLSNLVFDVLMYLMTETLVIIVFFVFHRKEFVGDGVVFAATFTLFFLYGLSSIPLSYLLSYCFKSHSTAQNVTMMTNFFCGFLLVMAAQILQTIETTRHVNTILCRFYRVIPAYALGEGIITLTSRELASQILGHAPAPFAWLEYHSNVGGFIGGVGTSLLYMGIVGPVLFLLLFVVEGAKRLRRRFKEYRYNKKILARDEEEEGAEAETETGGQAMLSQEVDGLDDEEQAAVKVRGLVKRYGKLTAVDELSFHVKRGETYGLLGVNGSGKTSTIKVLVGEHLPDGGVAHICGMSLGTDISRIRRIIGYCPQFDALHEHMSVQEHLDMYARVRGMPKTEEANREVKALVDGLGLTAYLHIAARSLSGGNKRKLSLAIAVIGNISVLLLDEPSAGMDPLSRREMFENLRTLTSLGKSIILTTHHLEEVEALCDRVGIMVKGQFACEGTLQELKQRYVGGEYEVQVSIDKKKEHANRTNSEQSATEQQDEEEEGAVANEITRALLNSCSNGDGVSAPACECQLLEHNDNKYTFNVRHLPLSRIFTTLEDNRDAWGLLEFSVSQATLEQVFLKVRGEGEEEET